MKKFSYDEIKVVEEDGTCYWQLEGELDDEVAELWKRAGIIEEDDQPDENGKYGYLNFFESRGEAEAHIDRMNMFIAAAEKRGLECA